MDFGVLLWELFFFGDFFVIIFLLLILEWKEELGILLIIFCVLLLKFLIVDGIGFRKDFVFCIEEFLELEIIRFGEVLVFWDLDKVFISLVVSFFLINVIILGFDLILKREDFVKCKEELLMFDILWFEEVLFFLDLGKVFFGLVVRFFLLIVIIWEFDFVLEEGLVFCNDKLLIFDIIWFGELLVIEDLEEVFIGSVVRFFLIVEII